MRMEENGLYLAEGVILDNRYVIKEVLGAGGFGVTYKAYDNLNHFVCAIKEYLPRDVSIRENTLRVRPASDKWKDEFEHGRIRFIEEADTLRKLSGYKSIVRITDYFDANNTSYFVMEYIDGVNLNKLRKTLGGQIPYKEAMDIIFQVCDGLERLHIKAGIFHRDISPENIMVSEDGQVKLVDFGNARNLSMQKGFSIVLKQGFAPIEQYSTSGIQGTYTDVYALAGTLYYILTGKMIPNAPERQQDGTDYVPLKNMGIGVPDKVSDAVDAALRLNQYERTQTVGEFKTALQAGEKEALLSKEIASEHLSVAENGKPYFEIINGQHKGKRYYVEPKTTIRLGRSKEMSDFCLGSDLHMSKIHCRLFYDTTNGLFYIEDCSINGTYINGQFIGENSVVPIEPGTKVVLGNHICEIEVGVSYE